MSDDDCVYHVGLSPPLSPPLSLLLSVSSLSRLCLLPVSSLSPPCLLLCTDLCPGVCDVFVQRDPVTSSRRKTNCQTWEGFEQWQFVCQNSRTQEVNSRTQEVNSRTQEVNSRTQEVNSRTQEVNSRTQEVNSRTQVVNSRTQEVNSRTQEVNSRTQEVNSRTQEVNSRTQEVNSRTQEVNSRTQEVNSRTQEVNLAPERRGTTTIQGSTWNLLTHISLYNLVYFTDSQDQWGSDQIQVVNKQPRRVRDVKLTSSCLWCHRLVNPIVQELLQRISTVSPN